MGDTSNVYVITSNVYVRPGFDSWGLKRKSDASANNLKVFKKLLHMSVLLVCMRVYHLHA